MARRTRTSAVHKEQELPILTALRFVQVAQMEHGTPYQTHCRFTGGEVIAFNGILAAGHPVHEEMGGCPNTYKLIAALERVRGAYSMTLLDTDHLAIVSGAFRALVPCVGGRMIDFIQPDPGGYALTDEWRKAAVIAGLFNTDGAPTVVEASVVTASHSMIGTNLNVVLEAWHGCHMPAGLIIPKAFVVAVNKINKPLARFGYSEGSFTVYFDDQSWLRTQLYQEAYPDVGKYLALTATAAATVIPEGFYNAVEAVVRFCDTSVMHIENNRVMSHATDTVGAQHECDGLPFLVSLNAKYVLTLKEVVKRVDFTTNESVIMFFGDKVRGVMAKVRR